MCLSLPSVMSVYCCLVVTCWDMADLLALLCVMFSCAFVTFPYGVMGRVWYLIVLIPELCFFSYYLTCLSPLDLLWIKTHRCLVRIKVSYIESVKRVES